MLEERFLNIFISEKNSVYLFDIIISKIINIYPQFKNIIITNLNQYKSNLIDLQNYIFKDYFYKLYNNTNQTGNVDLEEILISLNQITIKHFEIILIQNLQQKSSQQSPSQPLQQPQQQLPQPQQLSLQQPLQQPLQQTQQLSLQQPQQPLQQSQSKTSNLQFDLKHFFSEDADFKYGKYYYKYSLKNIKSLSLQSIKIVCNIYNINENNNNFYILYENKKQLISIPIGYYSINDLVKCLNKLLKNEEFQIIVYKDNIKNKIIFKCEFIARSITNIFSIHFMSGNSNIYNNYSLSEILGFKETDYINNSYYISENHPINNIYEDLFLKIFINDKELTKYNTTKYNFSYFETISIDMDKSFGKSLKYTPTIIDPYDIYENINVNTISFQFNNNFKYHLNTPIDFHITLGFEYL
jgi:hypothetical protein